jgi:uncharacterized protein (TIGR03118 family)
MGSAELSGRRRTGWSGGGRRLGIALVGAAALALAGGALASGATSKGVGASMGPYVTHNLVSDQPGKADLRDPDLVNPWGLSFGTDPATPAWVANDITGNSTLYTGDTAGKPVKKLGLTVTIPGGAPAGIVFNDTKSFVVKSGGKKGPANFIFSSITGKITAWSGDVPPLTSAHTEASVAGGGLTGLALANTSKGPRLYAADVSRSRIEVWDGSFDRVKRKGAFTDPKIPSSYGPFNIDALHGKLFVTYAKHGGYGLAAPGPGFGFVDMYSKGGKLLQRFASHGPLNAPWAIVKARSGWGTAGGTLLIGNFGDGRINAFDPDNGKFLGALENGAGNPIRIDGLWALEYGNGVMGTPRTLLFTAGPDGMAHGLFGDIKPG